MALNENNFEVDLIATMKCKPNDSDMSSMRRWVNNVTIVPRHMKLTSGLSTLPFQLKSRRGLSSVPMPRSAYDVALLESEYVAPILDNPGLQAGDVFLRVHNNETRYFMELGNSESRFAKKLYYYSECPKFRVWLPRIHKRVDALFFISSSECEESTFRAKSFWVPPSININKIIEHKGTSKTVLFVGSLFMPNNLEGISWYVNFVHDRLLDIPDYKLIVAGNSRGIPLGAIFNKDRIVVYDSPNDATLDNLYALSSVFVAPMFHGAGVKMKVINAINSGLPVVATNVSNEGSGLHPMEHLLVSDEPTEFANCIRSLLCSTAMRAELVKNAQAFITEHYDSTNLIRHITDCCVAYGA